MAERWTRDSWRGKPIVQVPEYPDRAALLRRLRAVRDRIDRDYAQPLDVEASSDRGEESSSTRDRESST